MKLRYGHAPGHVLDVARNGFEVWLNWDDAGSEPTVEYETHYVLREIPISKACGLVWNCTDIVPGHLFDALCDAGLDIKQRTYAACARAIAEAIKLRKIVRLF